MPVEQAMQLDREQHDHALNTPKSAPARVWDTIESLIDHLTYCDDVACDCGTPPDAAF